MGEAFDRNTEEARSRIHASKRPLHLKPSTSLASDTLFLVEYVI